MEPFVLNSLWSMSLRILMRSKSLLDYSIQQFQLFYLFMFQSETYPLHKIDCIPSLQMNEPPLILTEAISLTMDTNPSSWSFYVIIEDLVMVFESFHT